MAVPLGPVRYLLVGNADVGAGIALRQQPPTKVGGL